MMHRYSVAVFGEEFFPHQVTTALCHADVETFTSVNVTTKQLLHDVVQPALHQPPQVDCVLLLTGQTSISQYMDTPVHKPGKLNN